MATTTGNSSSNNDTATAFTAMRQRVRSLLGLLAISFTRQCQGRFQPTQTVLFVPRSAPMTTCADLIVQLNCRPDDDLQNQARPLGEFLRLLHLVIAQCHPTVLNELLVGSPCPLIHCAFCDDSSRVGSVRLLAMAPSETGALRRALFSWDEQRVSEDYRELRQFLQGPMCRSMNAAPTASPLRISIGLLTAGWWRQELSLGEDVQDAQCFIQALKGSCEFGELDSIHIYQDRVTHSVSDLEPILRVFMESGLPIVLGEPGGRGLWRGAEETLSWLLGNDEGTAGGFSDAKLVGLTLDKVDPPTPDEFGRFCRMLATPSVRDHLRMLTMSVRFPLRNGTLDSEAAKQFSRALFDPSTPLRLSYLALTQSLDDGLLAAMVDGRAQVLTNQASVTSFDNVSVDSPGISEAGYNHLITLVGATVKRLELIGQCRSISPKLLQRILSECPQLEHLNVRLGCEDWELHLNSGVAHGANVAPLTELILDIGATLAHDMNQESTPQMPVPSTMMTTLLRSVGRNLRLFSVELPTPDTADRNLAETLAAHCPKLQSLMLSNAAEEFVSALIRAMEDPFHLFQLQSLRLPLLYVTPASPLTRVLLDKRSHTNCSLRALSLCATRVEQDGRERIKQQLQNLVVILQQNRTLSEITLEKSVLYGAGPDEQLLITQIKKTDKQLTDTSVRPPKQLQLVLLGVFHGLAMGPKAIPAETIELIWAFHSRRLPRRITLQWR